MKMSNLTKDKLKILAILILLIWIVSGIFYYLFADNREYNEEQIKTEIRYLTMWEYTENMSDEEYQETFFK